MSKPSDMSSRRVVGPGPAPALPVPTRDSRGETPSDGADIARLPQRDRNATTEVITPTRLPQTDLARQRHAYARATSIDTPRNSIHDLPPLPVAHRRRRWPTLVSFALVAVLPTLAAGVYFNRFAADIYVSEFRFSVTENAPILPGTNPSQAGAKGSAASAGLTGLLGGFGGGIASSQNFMVVDYITSRQVVQELWQSANLKAIYSAPAQDRYMRFDPSQSFEKFVPYWQSMVHAAYDPVTGLAQVRVKAFTPEDALKIANELQLRAESLVNDIAKRAQGDSMKFAEAEVARAEDRVKKSVAELQAFRKTEAVIDPTTNVVPVNTALTQQLRQVLNQQMAQRSSLTTQGVVAASPLLRTLDAQIGATKEQLAKLEGEFNQKRDATNTTGKQGSLADNVAKYERLDLERQYAQQMYISAKQAFDQARANAAAQHLYLTPYVRPSLPLSPTEPHRVQGTLLAAGSCFAIWLILLVLTRSVRDHVA
jgi:capsular polysaccharide transport system permease protein